MDLAGKRVLVVGLARSGRAAAASLAKRGAVVTVTDSKPPSNENRGARPFPAFAAWVC